MFYSKKNILLFCILLFSVELFSQSDNCVVGTSQLLTPGALGVACAPSVANTNAGFTDSNQGCTAGTEDDDGWFRFVATATSHTVTVDGAANMDVVLGVYSNCTGTAAAGGACINATGINGIETCNLTGLTIGNTYYICVHDLAAGGGDFTICITTPYPSVNMSNTTTTACGNTFLDNGGSGNYTNNQNITHTFCPSVVGQCVSVSFSAMSIETGFDFLYVYDGNSTITNQFAGSPFTGTTTPGPFTGTTTNASGCITFNFVSDGSVVGAGWTATVTCNACAVVSPTAQDCGALVPVCNDIAFAGNSSGTGNFGDLNPSNSGCLNGENQSSWYSFTATTGGTISLNISPSNGTDDYDFAIWGPLVAAACPPVGAPLRCSWAGVPGNTGLGSGAVDLTEGAAGNGWVAPIVATTGDNYILLIDNYTSSAQPFTLDWTLTGGASLGCVPLPIELVTFTGQKENDYVRLEWTTFSETNNDYFTAEKSMDGINFNEINTVDGAGNSTQIINYNLLDNNPIVGINYYRIKQTDYNGQFAYSSIISVDFVSTQSFLNNIHPNPTNNDISFDFYSISKGELDIQIIDCFGRVMFENTETIIEGKSTVFSQISELIAGVYSLKVRLDKTGYVSVSKIMKQ